VLKKKEKKIGGREEEEWAGGFNWAGRNWWAAGSWAAGEKEKELIWAERDGAGGLG
jgi:hypothetical protein